MIPKAIAKGDSHCEVVIMLDESDPRALTYDEAGDEYYERVA